MNSKSTALILIVTLTLVMLGVWYAVSSAQREALSTGTMNTNPLTSESNITTNQNNKDNTMIDPKTTAPRENETVTLRTNKGDIVIELFLESAPVTAGNFLSLVESDFYVNTKFHRVISDFMIQGGDPNTKDEDETMYGTGGPGYSIQDEFAPGLSNIEGTISMANSGPNTGGSQFFINTANNTFLDGKHAVFGRVISGLDVVSQIESSETKERDIPVEPIVINATEIVATDEIQ